MLPAKLNDWRQGLPADLLTGHQDARVYDVLAPNIVDSGAHEISVEHSNPQKPYYPLPLSAGQSRQGCHSYLNSGVEKGQASQRGIGEYAEATGVACSDNATGDRGHCRRGGH